MNKVLTNILKGIEHSIVGDPTVEIKSVHFDSRKVSTGDMFVAVKGTQADGHAFIDQVIENGAKVIVCQHLPLPAKGVTYVQVANSAKALGQIASNYYDNPSEKLQLVGITGTNGKTSIATLLYNTFMGLGYKAGLLSTIRNYIAQKTIDATHTTPDALAINKLLSEMVNEGCQYAFMEASSHAIDQERTTGLKFAGAVFTNITHDHLDYHKTFDAYIKAKKKLFDELPATAFALVNEDDRNSGIMTQNCKARVKGYSLMTPCQYKGKIIEQHFEGLQLQIGRTDIWTRLTGTFNASNILAVYAVGCELHQDSTELMAQISQLKTVDGRFDVIRFPENITAVVDYAHTPDAVKKVLDTINQIRTADQSIITVIGAGGDRDKEKRPKMAQIAANSSDLVILTSDNPRNEEPQQIIEDMRAGLSPEQMRKTLIITDRKEAIRTACIQARANDIILVAGKGHETYQEIKGVRHYFNDKQVIQEHFASLN